LGLSKSRRKINHSREQAQENEGRGEEHTLGGLVTVDKNTQVPDERGNKGETPAVGSSVAPEEDEAGGSDEII
jgi:hypothetical protein